MTVDTRLGGGTVVFPTGTAEANVLIAGERIAGVTGEPGHGTFLDRSIPDWEAGVGAGARSDANAEGPV